LSLGNWVILKPGVEVKLHFREYRITPREIEDPFWKVGRRVNSLLFLVDKEDGKPVDKMFSVISDRLAGEFEPYLEDGSYKDYEWTIVKGGNVMVPPRIAGRIRV